MSQILIVDDNLDGCRPLATLLRRRHYEADCVESGRKALAYLKSHRPDLVLLDISMPEMDGFEVLRQIRANSDTTALPVVMFTAFDQPEFQTKARRTGATDYWLKGSLALGEMVNRIREYVGECCAGGSPL